MRLTVKELRELIAEAKIAASAEYMKKERVRQQLQDYVASQVRDGKVSDQRSLESLLARIDGKGDQVQKLAVTALKMIPFEVWKKLAAA